MKGDLSRNTFDRTRHYSAVRLQQGRIVTDADWNEQADLTRYRTERVARDTIGACGVPLNAAGYSLVAETRALAVHAANANVVWIAAEDGVLLQTSNGGADWTLTDLGTTANLRALQQVGGTGWVVGDGGVVRKTSNLGASFVAQNAGTLATLRALSVFDADHAWAAGDDGIVVATTDGGANWSLVKTEAARLYAIHFVDEFAGVAVGRGGAILSTNDGGQTWTRIDGGTTAHLRALAAFGTTQLWSAGQNGTILRSADGGATWTISPTPSQANLYAIAFRDQNEGWAVGDGGVLLHSLDGGATWTVENVTTQADLRALSVSGSDAAWVVGDASIALRIGGGSPDTADVALPAVNLTIEPGRCYVNGVMCELESRASYVHQPDGGAGARLAPGGYLMYLDAWQRHISSLEAPEIREIALGGPDTATRARTIAQVRALPLPPSSPFDFDCGTTLAAWDALINAPVPLLSARSEPQLAATSLCEIAATAGYRRLENQLYRVEVHSGGSTPTFKWSRENGSVAYAVVSVSVDSVSQRTTVRLAARGRDDNLDLTVNDRVELIDDDAELTQRAGTMLEYLNDGDDELELVLAGVPGGTLGQDPSRHPILRRWDHRPTTAGANELPITTGNWIELEEGVQVRFSPGGQYRAGDFWQIPARTISADVEWPRDDEGDPVPKPPVGIADAYCRIGIVEVADDGRITVVDDCRKLFEPLTSHELLYYVSGDGQDAAPGSVLPQPLALRVSRGKLPLAGRRIRLEVESGGGSLDGSGTLIEVVTDAEGQAACDWRLGPGFTAPARFQRVRASLLDCQGQSVPGQVVVFCATATLTLRYVSGDGQTAAAGGALPFPLEMQVANGGDGIAGVVLRALVEFGGGSITGASTQTTDATGHAAFRWQLGGAGPQRLRVELLDGAGQAVQRLSFDATLLTQGGTSRRNCDVTIGRGGDFPSLTPEVLGRVLELGERNACICFLPGVHELPTAEFNGPGSRLSLHGCGHASIVNIDGPMQFNQFDSLELRDLVVRPTNADTGIRIQRIEEVLLNNVLFDRSRFRTTDPALVIIQARNVSVTGCEILANAEFMAVLFDAIEGNCRFERNRCAGLVTFYGPAEFPTDALLSAIGERRSIAVRPTESQLYFCHNEVSAITVGTELARRLATPNGTATRVFATAVLQGNTFMERNNLFAAGLIACEANSFLARVGANSRYGVMISVRSTATANLALEVLPDAGPFLQFITQSNGTFEKAANAIRVVP